MSSDDRFNKIPPVQDCPRCPKGADRKVARYTGYRLSRMEREGQFDPDNRTFACDECKQLIYVAPGLRLSKPKTDTRRVSQTDVSAEVLRADNGASATRIQMRASDHLPDFDPSQFVPEGGEQGDTVDTANDPDFHSKLRVRAADRMVMEWIRRGRVLGGRFELRPFSAEQNKLEIGRGATAAVALATDRENGRKVAVKFAFETALEGEQRKLAVARVMRVHNLQSVFSTIHVPRPIALVAEGGMLISVEEYIPGVTAWEALEKGETVQQPFAIMIALQLCNVLDKGWHEKRIIHRDIKPHNMILGTDASGSASTGLVVRLIDWGLCRSVDSGRDTRAVFEDELDKLTDRIVTETLTLSGTVMGTLNYMPPEQLMGGRVDLRTDIYSLGATIYHMVTGVPPLQSDSMGTLVTRIRMTDPEPAYKVALLRGQWVSQNLSNVLQKAMAKDPGRRFQDYTSFKKALMSCQYDIQPSEDELARERAAAALSNEDTGMWKRLKGFLGGN